MPYKVVVGGINPDTHDLAGIIYADLKTAIDFAKSMLYETQGDIRCVCVTNTKNDLVLWSSDDPPEFELALKRCLAGSDIQCEQSSVYFDIDGVLGKWYADARGYSSIEEIIDPCNHYFRDIEPHPAAIELAKTLCEKGADVCIISAADINIIRDKWEWLAEHLPFIRKENIFFSPLGANKAEYIKGNSRRSLLIDDYNVNLNAWDGKAMKAINTVNSHQDKYPEFDIATAEIAEDLVARKYIDRVSSTILAELKNM